MKEPSVRYVKLGHTGLDISPLAIGAMTYGDPARGHPVWSLDEAASRPLIRHALEAGINFFDTANMYSQGSSEEILGRALKDFAQRDEVVIATKVRHPMRAGPNGAGLSRKAIFAEIDNSLRRLGVNHVDLYQIHRLDPSTPLEETLEALHDVVKAGKARYLGASSMRAWEFSKALHLQRAHRWARFVSMQDHYNLLYREEEREMIPLCLDQGVAVLPYSPLACGVLAGNRGRQGGRQTARAGSDPLSQQYYDSPADFDLVDRLAEVAAARRAPPAQVALAWLLSRPGVTAPIIGATRLGHIGDALAAGNLTLTDEEVRRLDEPYRPHSVLGHH
jgi:aryl-alcohol dehydrogenase-like predicted oxidoreductase